MSNATVNYSCPNCGGKLQFDPQKQTFSCEWCASDFTEAELKNMAPAVEAETQLSPEEAAAFENGTNLYICDSCGAEIIAEENTAATFCYYCHSPVSLKGRLSGEYCPEKIIPFKKAKIEAESGFKEWCGKKWFLPSDFKSQGTIEKITGLYVPYWLADCRVHGSLTANAEIIHTTRHGDTTVEHHKVFLVNREVNAEFDGVPADGSKKLDDALMDSVEPFDYSEMKEFSMSYLQGFYADKYDVSKEEVMPRIQARVSEGTKELMMADVMGYTTVTPVSSEADIRNVKWHYTMLPVWFLSYDYNGKKYFYAMNGQTGKFTGIMPVSKFKVALGAVITAVVTALIGGAIALVCL